MTPEGHTQLQHYLPTGLVLYLRQKTLASQRVVTAILDLRTIKPVLKSAKRQFCVTVNCGLLEHLVFLGTGQSQGTPAFDKTAEDQLEI